MAGLWGQEFELKNTKDKVKKTIDLTKNLKVASEKDRSKYLNSKSVSLTDKLRLIKSEVLRILGVYAQNTVVIRSKQELQDYIDASIKNGIIAIDTETNNSLDPISCKLMGGCIYTPGQKNAYIPINHVDVNSGERFSWQVTEDELKEQFERLKSTNILMHNGKFDYQVIKCTCNVALDIYWDTLIGAKVLDETERAGLKSQYISKIDPTIEKYSIDKLFEKIEYAVVDPEIFALYAATDAYMTYKLYEYQKAEFSKAENAGLYSLFKTVEMPVIPVVAEMELTGVHIDVEYAKRLELKYQGIFDSLETEITKELHKYDQTVENWRLTPEANEQKLNRNGNMGKTKNEQLDTPVKLTSNTQLAILLYDILKQPVVDKKNPRGTGEDILSQMDLPICKLILKQRGLLKVLNTYIKKLPECVSEVDGRLHAHFNQFGADTGRFSSSDPNLQNIPSHNNEIRMMFSATPGYVMLGSDYSQQEPRLLSHYSQDHNMIDAYTHGKDLYAMIASKVYKNNYEDNLEFHPVTREMQPEGKHRRTAMKTLLLGIMYGRGVSSIAEQLNCSIQEAEDIKRGFFDEFPNVETWINDTHESAHKVGYVEDIWGRRRRLPNLLKQKYEITTQNKSATFNPLLHSKGVYSSESAKLINYYRDQLDKCKWKKEVDKVKNEASQKGLVITDNSGRISQAERQCVNARIQGGAATMSKRAMIRVATNQELKSLGFRLLIPVHDELIGEVPVENVERAKELLAQEMINAAKPEVTVPIKCDADDFPCWYYDVYTSEVKEEYHKNNDFEALCKNHTESTREQLENIISA